MENTINSNQIVSTDVIISTMALFVLFSAFSFQNAFVNNASAREYHIKSENSVNYIKNNYSTSQENVEKTDIVIEAQKWDTSIRNRYKYGQIKTIDEGIKHISIKKTINNRPVKINVVEVNKNINPNITLSPALATSDKLNSRASIRKIAQENNSVVAVNGGFFKPQNGVPLGSLMIDGKLLTGPMYNRVALGIFDDDLVIDRVELNAEARGKDYTLKIDNINQPRMLSTYVLVYTNEWGEYAPQSPQYGMQVAIKDNKVVEFSTNRLQIPDGGYVIVGPKDKLMDLASQKEVKISLNTNPNWNGVKHIISGGPYLIKNNNIYIDVSEQKLNSITGRNPRTAIGITADKNLVLVTVDGREEASVGMTLTELANFMKEIGCVEAMNLDGGGSSVMYVDGSIVNNPSVKGGIAISNALTVSLPKEKISMSEEK